LYRLTNASWNELVWRRRKLGFEGPYLSSGPHPYFMKRGDLTVDLPNPHKQDIGVGLTVTNAITPKDSTAPAGMWLI
jgi:hypothetical protein